MNLVYYWKDLYGDHKILAFLLLVSIALGVVFGFIFLVKLISSLSSKRLSPNERYQRIWFFDLFIWVILIPFPMVFIYPVLKLFKSHWRKKQLEWWDLPRFSSEGKPMNRLSYKQQDIALSKGLIEPWHVKNDWYVVFAPKDYSEVLVLSTQERWKYSDRKVIKKGKGKHFNKYRQCPKCRRKTMKEQKKAVSKSKIQRINIWKCTNCQYEHNEISNIESTFKYKPRKSTPNNEDIDIFDGSDDSSGTSWGDGSSRSGGSTSNW